MASGIGLEFLERTKYRHMREPSDQQKGLPAPRLEVTFPGEGAVHELPKCRPLGVGAGSLKEIIDRRRSVRTYAATGLSRDELGYLLWCSQGVQELLENGASLRTVPSAGARHALETYVLVNHVLDLKPGLYRYLAVRHGLTEAGAGRGVVAVVSRQL